MYSSKNKPARGSLKTESKQETIESKALCENTNLKQLGFLQKGGDPATPSGTATLLRLSPSH